MQVLERRALHVLDPSIHLLELGCPLFLDFGNLLVESSPGQGLVDKRISNLQEVLPLFLSVANSPIQHIEGIRVYLVSKLPSLLLAGRLAALEFLEVLGHFALGICDIDASGFAHGPAVGTRGEGGLGWAFGRLTRQQIVPLSRLLLFTCETRRCPWTFFGGYV